MYLACYAPSPQGRPAIEVGAHETEPTARGTIRIEFDPRLIPVQGVATTRSDLVLWVDQVGYRLPAANYSDFYGYWGAEVGWDDPLFSALERAQSVVLAPGTDQPWQLVSAGLGPALAQVKSGCATDWSAPPATAQPPAGQVTIPAAVFARVAQDCGAPAPVPPSAVQAGDLDNDGRPDFVLDWGGITCPGRWPRPLCGAANCSHYVFLSSRGYARHIDFLGTSLVIIPHPRGGLGLKLGGTFSLCGANGEFCATPYQWDGASFVERP